MRVYEAKTRNGRLFRVTVENKAQFRKLIKAKQDSKGKYEEIVSVSEVLCGIHNMSSFLKLASSFQ